MTSLLIGAQNSDGGWGFLRGASAAEPTALALLALGGDPHAREAAARGRAWLVSHQRADGGWAPRPEVDQSTYVTSLALLALDDQAERTVLRKGVEWLLRQTNRDAGLTHRLRLALMGGKRDLPSEKAWSWFPGTAGWVTPTAFAMLALRRWRGSEFSDLVRERIEAAQAYLWSRMCRDGGWNHGSSKALGYEAESYPETTGQALVALQGSSDARLARALAAAERHWTSCRSVEGVAWLQLGLLAHGRPLPPAAARRSPPRTTLDHALNLLAARALNGDHAFLEVAGAA